MKLSKGVLGLKFMTRTRLQNQQQETEKKLKKHFKPEIESKSTLTTSSIKIESQTDSVSIAEKTFSSKDCTVIVCPSYLHCERFVYARQSYGGMNPSVEENIRKGVWRMEYELSGPEDEEDGQTLSSKLNFQKPATFDMIDSDEGGGPEYKINIKEEEDEEEEGEVDSDEEEKNAKVYGSIVATLGKKFNKHNRKQQQDKQKNEKSSHNRKRPHTQDPQDSYDGAAMSKKRKKGFWKNKNKERNSNNND